jgi:DNA mismatch repair ATPase MutL
VREAVRAALANAGYVRGGVAMDEAGAQSHEFTRRLEAFEVEDEAAERASRPVDGGPELLDAEDGASPVAAHQPRGTHESVPPARQESIEFGFTPTGGEDLWREGPDYSAPQKGDTARGLDAMMRQTSEAVQDEPFSTTEERADDSAATVSAPATSSATLSQAAPATHERIEEAAPAGSQFPPLVSAVNLVREVPQAALATNIRPLGQLEDSFIIATDDEGLLLIDQHVAHERILFEKYRGLEKERSVESQNLLMPETFDLTPAQVSVFETVAAELEAYGFGLMRLSGRTVAIKAVPADLPAGEARNLLAEILDTTSADRRGAARTSLHERIAARLACAAAVKANTPLSTEKMRWLIDRLLLTSSPTTDLHGRPAILRLTMRDIEKSFHRS